ncbi:hypothetical protein [Halorarum salinum]|uniref:Uncharacterized protein n=1 Tax=Halorarum salinum TaxID=2743089 RepID=A0A7D5QB19_9EURY|nr:hypothetical protein [Halobaculum salinum]QLG61899.1 hypothetical protein HUG12_09270 [Halobaculum salinum]
MFLSKGFNKAVLLETALGLLRTFATELARLEERSDTESEPTLYPYSRSTTQMISKSSR